MVDPSVLAVEHGDEESEDWSFPEDEEEEGCYDYEDDYHGLR